MRSKGNWVIVSLAVVVAILLCASSFLAYRSGWVGQGVARLEGLQWLLRQLDVGQADPEEKAMELLQRGAALEQEGRYREAIQVYEQVLEFAPDEPVAYVALASAYETLGEWGEALAQMEKAAELDPEDANIQRHLGRLLCLAGEHQACVETLEKAVEMEPDNSWGRYWLGLAYHGSAQEGLDKALAQYYEALRIDPEFGKAHLALGRLYRGQPGKEALAFEEFNRALDVALDEGDEELAARARAELAGLYYAQDNYTQCIEEWKQVLETDPNNADAHRRLGLCYAMRKRAGDMEQAIAELEQALALTFENIDAYYYYLGLYYAMQEDYPRAVWAWEQFLRFSDNEELKAEVRKWIE